MHKRIRNAFLVAAISLAVGLWPASVLTPAFADEALPQNAPTASQTEEQSEQEPQLASQDGVAEHMHDGIAFSPTDVLPNEAGNYYLTADVTITSTWKPANGTKLCLNGHTITANIEDIADGGSVVTVGEGLTFSLYDCGNGVLQPAEGKIISYGVDSMGGATFNMYGGTIKGFRMGVHTDLKSGNTELGTSATFGTFNLYDGTITECTAHGVYVFSGTFNMCGGLITGNTSEDDGAGVYVQYSEFKMTDGVISNNMASRNGGGLCVFKTDGVSIEGGSIEGNSALGTFTAEDDEGGNGGGVYVVAPTGNGSASLTMTGGSIRNNVAAKLGGGVYVNEKSTLKVSGAPNVSGNTVAGKTSNVHIGGKPITVADKLEDGASMGITLASDSVGLEAFDDASTDALVFTAGYKEKGGKADPQTHFFSDDEAFLVGWTEDSKEARLVTAYNVVVEEAKNGTVIASATKARAGDSVTLAITPSDGHRLKSLVVLDANKEPVEVADNAFTMPASDVTVSATFEVTRHTITFEANGGTGTMGGQVVETGESAALTANKFTRSGYTFSHWNTKEDGSGTSYEDGATVEPTGDMTLYAQWSKNGSSGTSGTSSSGTTKTSSLASTADPTSAMGAMAMLASGVGAVYAGIRRRRR